MGNNNFIWSKVHNPWTFIHVQIQRSGEGGGVLTTPYSIENLKAIDFLQNTALAPLQITKLPSQCLVLGHHHFNGVSLVGKWWPALVTEFRFPVYCNKFCEIMCHV